jgi:myo-inositol 2-dehydrogenase/D-chiro-inositol 1-dehydrogenase
MAAERLRLGVIGLGAVAQAVHLPILARRRDLFEVAAVCDLSPALLGGIGDRYGVPAPARFRAAAGLLASGLVDGVAILTSGSHGRLAADALAAGLPVLCEKPLAYTLAEADALPPGRLQLGYMKLYDPAVVRAVQARVPPEAVRSVEVTVLHPASAAQLAHAGVEPAPADVPPAEVERLRAAEAALLAAALGPVPASLSRLYAGVLLGSVVHDLALVRALVGDPVGIDHAEAWPDGAELGSVALLGRLPGGGRLSIRWHYLDGYPAYREEVRVHHDGGTMTLTFPSPYLLHAPTTLEIVYRDGAGERRERLRWVEEAFELELLAFHRLALTGEAPAAGVAEGRADIRTCQLAARRLAERQGIDCAGEAANA